MIVADFRVIALGEGTSLEEAVEQALKVLDDRGIKYEVGPMGTTVQVEAMEDLLNAVSAAHAKLRGTAGRIITQITIDERLDKEETAESLKEVHRSL
jgi:uncharacterized protein (TIGR00106 family)